MFGLIAWAGHHRVVSAGQRYLPVPGGSTEQTVAACDAWCGAFTHSGGDLDRVRLPQGAPSAPKLNRIDGAALSPLGLGALACNESAGGK